MGDMLNIFMIGMLLFVGGFGIYTAIRLLRERILFKSRFLYPANCNPEECLDPAGFINFITPHMLAVSIFSLVLGIGLALIIYAPFIVLPPELFWVQLILIPALGICALAWFMFIQNRAHKRFW